MIFYLVGVVLIAIAIVYFNYLMLPKLAKTWQFWFASTLLCLMSWLVVLLVIVLTIKHAIINGKEKTEKEGDQ